MEKATQKIMVTGGTGYIGSWLVKGLLENGHTVRLTVRNKSKESKYDFLKKIADNSPGSLEIWEADLLKTGSFDKIAEGCDSIAHVASPFKLKFKDARKELVDPAVDGTKNVLEAANRSTTVKKVVLTSSAVSVYGDASDMKNQGLEEFTEDHFNTSSTVKNSPYGYSKVTAEKKAWEMAGKQSEWKLVVVNPSFVMGPVLGKSTESESVKFMNDMLSGKLKSGTAELYFGFVDVRDVAKAHIFCLENEAEGRHILSAEVMDMLSIANIIRKNFDGKYKLPKSNHPKWIISLIGGLFGLSRQYVKNNVGIPIKLNSDKSKEKLKLNYTPIEQTLTEMVDQMGK